MSKLLFLVILVLSLIAFVCLVTFLVILEAERLFSLVFIHYKLYMYVYFQQKEKIQVPGSSFQVPGSSFMPPIHFWRYSQKKSNHILACSDPLLCSMEKWLKKVALIEIWKKYFHSMFTIGLWQLLNQKMEMDFYRFFSHSLSNLRKPMKTKHS